MAGKSVLELRTTRGEDLFKLWRYGCFYLDKKMTVLLSYRQIIVLVESWMGTKMRPFRWALSQFYGPYSPRIWCVDHILSRKFSTIPNAIRLGWLGILVIFHECQVHLQFMGCLTFIIKPSLRSRKSRGTFYGACVRHTFSPYFRDIVRIFRKV